MQANLLAGQVVGAATEQGLLLVPAGLKVVRFVPPLVITAAEIDEALQKVDRAVAAAIAKAKETPAAAK
jgi:acetylornithine/N-succinyldiaminopimelate aminotransferase